MDGSCQFDRLIEVQFVYETYAVRPLNPKKYRQKIISPQILLENLKLFFLRKIKWPNKRRYWGGILLN